MKFKITTNGYSVIDSGAFMLYDSGADAIFDIDTEREFRFRVILKFTKDDNKDNYELSKDVSGNTIIFTCVNFTNQLGTGTIEPLSVATVGGKEVFMHFWSYLKAESVRKVEYTFLQQE